MTRSLQMPLFTDPGPIGMSMGPRDPEVVARVEELRKNPGMWGIIRVVTQNNAGRTLGRLSSYYPEHTFVSRKDTTDPKMRAIWGKFGSDNVRNIR